MSTSPQRYEEGEDELISSPELPPAPAPAQPPVRPFAHRPPPLDDDPTSGITHIDPNDPYPRRPIITPTNKFNLRPPPSPSDDQDEERYSFSPISDDDEDDYINLPPLTYPQPDDPVVQALGVAASSAAIANGHEEFSISHEDMRRYRTGAFVRLSCDVEGPVSKEALSQMTVSEAVWRKWEEVGGLAKGAGGLFRYAYDKGGREYRPEMTHIQAIRLVIAASPRRMMTLAQIYQAIKERWPWHKTAGSTWKNSIRHNLSLNDCFVNADRPTHEGGSGKGGYWVVNDKLSGKTARKGKPRTQLSYQDDLYTTTPTTPFSLTPLSATHFPPVSPIDRSTIPAGYSLDRQHVGQVPPGYTVDYMGKLLKGVKHPKRRYAQEDDSFSSSSSFDDDLPPHGQSPKKSRPSLPASSSSTTIPQRTRKHRARNSVFPSIPIELPVRGPNWEPREKVHRPFVRPDWDMPLDNPRGGVWNQIPVGFGESREREVGRDDAEAGTSRDAEGSGGGGGSNDGQGKGWTSNHPRLETRSSRHQSTHSTHPPPSPSYPTPNTSHWPAGGGGGVGLGIGLPGWDSGIPRAAVSPGGNASPAGGSSREGIPPPPPALLNSPTQAAVPQTPLTASHFSPLSLPSNPRVRPPPLSLSVSISPNQHLIPQPQAHPQNQNQSLPPLTSVISKAHRDPASARRKTKEELREERERKERRVERLRKEGVAFQAAQAQAQDHGQAQGQAPYMPGQGQQIQVSMRGREGQPNQSGQEQMEGMDEMNGMGGETEWRRQRDEQLEWAAAEGVQGVELLALAAAEVRK
ncbi:hypothetical protein I350_03857 [Cryptococcus amylolentus CBS 6273]|uniref:Fork-head domain-containing protein n=1 Tax=Cryptococcus amylolentus CBS 6273 TaxID=1296118 RepID=A0A1E3K6V2_9TREE|nr:hypothetical protein I350_03857 [Cryptococcus amylolentus CBS 6273]